MLFILVMDVLNSMVRYYMQYPFNKSGIEYPSMLMMR